jgi:hypothetical protein
MASLLKRGFGKVFQAGLALNAWLTRSRLQVLERRVTTPLFVAATKAMRRVRPQVDAEALGREWERVLASRRTAHLTAVDPTGTTAYGEISVHCPLRGTGDVHACHRLMAYDRALVEAAGGQFVVLESQATPGVTVCRVAIRAKGAPLDDLPSATARAARST